VHACGMAAALLMFAMREVLVILARGGRVRAAAAAIATGRLAEITTTVGVLAGIALFFLGRWPLTAWLIASLALIALLMLVERRVVSSWQQRAKASLDSEPSRPEIRALMADRRALVGRLTNIAIFAVIATLMTLKPQFGLAE